MSLNLKHTEACFSSNATDSLCLLVAQVPRPRDMMIFVLTITTITTMTTCAGVSISASFRSREDTVGCPQDLLAYSSEI